MRQGESGPRIRERLANDEAGLNRAYDIPLRTVQARMAKLRDRVEPIPTIPGETARDVAEIVARTYCEAVAGELAQLAKTRDLSGKSIARELAQLEKPARVVAALAGSGPLPNGPPRKKNPGGAERKTPKRPAGLLDSLAAMEKHPIDRNETREPASASTHTDRAEGVDDARGGARGNLEGGRISASNDREIAADDAGHQGAQDGGASGDSA